jgi:hypothetical protein
MPRSDYVRGWKRRVRGEMIDAQVEAIFQDGIFRIDPATPMGQSMCANTDIQTILTPKRTLDQDRTARSSNRSSAGKGVATIKRIHVWRHLAFGTIAFFGSISSLRAQAGNETVASSTERCEISESDHKWIDQALAAWRFAEVRELHLTPKPLPPIEVFDDRCQYISESPQKGPTWKGSIHGSTIALPDGSTVPFGVVSFAAPVAGHTDAGFFVMSLPSVWHANHVQSGLGLERLMNGVLLHEMTHTRQFYFVNPTMDRLAKVNHLSDDIGDDSLQDAFSKDPKYVADYERERDLLYEAALAPDDAEARRIAKKALAQVRARRSMWFTGKLAYWREVDEVFLTMEGLGQWTAYAWLTDPEGAHIAPTLALPEVRRKRNRWTQDEGLALFLLIDRLVPGWQVFAFAKHPELAYELLERAVSSP